MNVDALALSVMTTLIIAIGIAAFIAWAFWCGDAFQNRFVAMGMGTIPLWLLTIYAFYDYYTQLGVCS